MNQEIMEWQWHQLDHTHIIYTLPQADSHASTLSLTFFTGRMLFLMLSQQRQSPEGMKANLHTLQTSQKNLPHFMYNIYCINLHIVNSPSAVMTNTNMLATTIPAIAERLRPEIT